jgi:hypothetical protein
MHLMIADRKQRENAGSRKQRSFPQPSRDSCPLCSLSLPFLLFLSHFPSFPGMSNAGNMPGTILDDVLDDRTVTTTSSTHVFGAHHRRLSNYRTRQPFLNNGYC